SQLVGTRPQALGLPRRSGRPAGSSPPPQQREKVEQFGWSRVPQDRPARARDHPPSTFGTAGRSADFVFIDGVDGIRNHHGAQQLPLEATLVGDALLEALAGWYEAQYRACALTHVRARRSDVLVRPDQLSRPTSCRCRPRGTPG